MSTPVKYTLPPPEKIRTFTSPSYKKIKIEIITADKDSFNVPDALDQITVMDLESRHEFSFKLDHMSSVPEYVIMFAMKTSPNTSAFVTTCENGKRHRLQFSKLIRRPLVHSLKTLRDRVDEAEYRREMGNVSFKASQYERALRRYKEVLRYVNYCDVLFHNSSAIPSAHRITQLAFLNSSACYLKLKEYDKVIVCCDHALQYDQNNEKAYFRRGCAYKELGQLEKAQIDLNHAMELNPDIKSRVMKLLRSIQLLERRRKARIRKKFAGVF